MKLQILSILTVLLFVTACSNTGDKTAGQKIDSIKNDSIQSVLIHKPDSFEITDSIVKEIQTRIRTNSLQKKSAVTMEAEGGKVMAYYYPDKSIAFLSTDFGAELGRNETVSFFENGNLIFSTYRFFQFMPDSKGQYDSRTELIVAEKQFYFQNNTVIKDTITVFNDTVKPMYPGCEFQYSRFPSAKQIQSKIETLKNVLAKSEN